MAHARKQIRDAVVTALTGLGQTGANVFPGRVLPLASANIPALLVHTSTEAADYEQGHMGNVPMRLITLTVEGYHAGDDDDKLDQIAAEVETALFVDHTFGGLAQYMSIEDMAIRRDGEGEKTTGVIELNFTVGYLAAEGAPETAL